MDRHGVTAFRFDSPDPETTFEIAALLGRSIGARGLALGLVGPLGSGKTVFVKGLAAGLGVDPRGVSSPTFVIAQEYAIPDGPETLHHLDFYRLETEAELESIGFLDLLRPGAVLAIEWLDRFPDVLGDDRLVVEFLPLSTADGEAAAGRRSFTATAYGDEASRILQDWRERWERLERQNEPTTGVGDAGARGAGAKLVVACLVSGLLGLAALGDSSDDLGTACAELAPASRGFVFGEPTHDALGAVQVVCAEATGSPGRKQGLVGIARLLDGQRIDPNGASQALLENLPGLGPGRAGAIIAERERHPFAEVGELERVPGIGPKTRAKLETFVAVDSGAPGG